MQKGNEAGKKKTMMWLMLIYACSVGIRYILAVATRNFPTVRIDEFLYYSLGRSIATEGSLLYLGQPALYNYIIYPLILSPIYWLFGQGTDYFRMIQLWNIILMSLAVFPIYGLCNAMVQKRKTALWLTGLFMVLPCFILGEFIFSEAVIYPLFFTLMYCIYKYLREKSIKYPIWIGILGAILYHTKPGAVLPAALALLLFAGQAAKQKSGKTVIQTVAGIACLAAGFFAIKLVAELVFGYHGALLSIYDTQSSFTENYDNGFFYYAAGRYPYYFIMACGICPFVLSIWNYPEYGKEDKQYYIFLVICALLTMIGTAWVVNRPEQKTILYLRYVEMYMPVLFAFNAMPEKEHRKTSNRSRTTTNVICYLVLCYLTICTFVWGCATGIGGSHETHYLISLAALFTKDIAIFASVLIILLAGTTLFLIVKKTGKQENLKICCAILAVLAILNNVEGYITTGKNTNEALSNESKEIYKQLSDQEFLHVYAIDQCDYGLDINSRQNLCRISEEELFNNIRWNHGVYVPFVPDSAQGMTAAYSTPNVNVMVVDANVYNRIQFSNDTSSYITKGNSFEIVRFERGKRIADSALFYDYSLTYVLTIYKEEWLNHPIKIRLEIESPTMQDMVMTADKDYSVRMDAGRYWYEIEVTEPINEYMFTVQGTPVTLYSYEVLDM